MRSVKLWPITKGNALSLTCFNRVDETEWSSDSRRCQSRYRSWTCHALPGPGPSLARCRRYGGFWRCPSHVFPRRECREGIQRREVRQTGNRILVTLGGSDPENLTPKIADALAYCSDLEITLIAGPGYDRADELRKLNASNLRVIFNPPNVAQFMRDSDQAIIDRKS